MRTLLSVAVLLTICAYLSEARVLREKKHAVHHKGSKKSEAPTVLDLYNKNEKCKDHPFCARYTFYDCNTQFVKNNCKNKCGLCGVHKRVKLPAVVYYNKEETEGNKRVAREARPTYPPTVTQKLFDYVSNNQHWNFNFPTVHPVWMDFKNPPPFLPSKNDNTQAQQNTAAPQQQNDQATNTAAAQPAVAQAPAYQAAQAPAYPAQASSVTAAQPAAYPATQAAYPNQANADQTPALQANNDATLKIKVPSSAIEQAKQGKDVYIAVLNTDDKHSAGNTTNSQTQAPSQLSNQAQIQTVPKSNDQTQAKEQADQHKLPNVPWLTKCPYGKCTYKGPSAPQVNHPFMVHCNDQFPHCGVLHSACNDSWLQIYCPKRCNLCRPEDQQQADQTKGQLLFDNKVYPSEVSSLKVDTPKLESELIAPAPGAKAQKAKYTLQVRPKLINGVAQPQEIAIMPPNSEFSKGVKPLVILKQTVTKPMIENIEIDVPKIGTQYSSEPKVEVIEGNNREVLKVSKGQADLNSAEAALEAKNDYTGTPTQATQVTQTQATPTEQTTQTQAEQAITQNTQDQATQTQAHDIQTEAAQTQATQTYQGAQSQLPASQVQTPQTYQDTQSQTSQTYQESQAQATQSQNVQAQATQAQASQDQAAQATQNQTPQTYQDTQSQTTQTPTQTQATQTPTAQAYQNSQTQTSVTATSSPAPADQTQTSAYQTPQASQQTYTASQCTDDNRCVSYTNTMCNENWLKSNCKKMCKLC